MLTFSLNKTKFQPRVEWCFRLGFECADDAQQASLAETLNFIEREELWGLGCGLIDILLLASTLMTPNAEIWTLDKRLSTLAERFGVMHQTLKH